LPLAWDDEETQKAIQKYVTTVNPEAPWCPSNIEFIRRINGLATQEEVKEILYGASYLVMGLGDVYLGAPVATPLDPRQRLVTTKYNPARTWTPENAVGIGGAYLCIYGMEGPGGYQFVGRTVQMWNRFRSTQSFPEGKPWLLNWFDQIRFYPVEDEELKKIREDFPQGRWHPHVEETSLCLADYLGFLRENAASIEEAKARQAKAFEAERLRWETAGQSMAALEVVEDDAASQAAEVPEGWFAIENGIPASVWQWRVAEGEKVVAGQTVCVLEAMKMEITVAAPQSGTLGRVFAREGKAVLPGEVLGAIQAEEEK
ncbi:MAG: carboxyltransferase domain-containing protein, partial [Verrucomicrobiota bacterium]